MLKGERICSDWHTPLLKNIYLHELVFRNIQYFINFENKLKYMCVWKFEKIKAWKTKSHVLLQALSDSSNYHEFYRLLARLKTNYQLGELVKVTNYPELIKRIAEFTITDQTDCRVYCDQSEGKNF